MTQASTGRTPWAVQGPKDAANALVPELLRPTDDMTAVIKLSRSTSKFPAILALAVVLHPVADGAEAVRRQQRHRRGRLASSTRPTPPSTRPAPARSSSTSTTRRTTPSPWSATTTTGARRPSRPSSIFKIIPDETARKQELQAGTIDGYDLPEPGRLGRAEGRGLQRRGPPGVQHPVPGHQPEEQPEAGGPQGPAGHRLRAQPRAVRQVAAARGRRGRDAVLPGHRRRLHRGRAAVRLRPGEGQGAARRGRRQPT